ncbi:MAG TPA: M56 family metallopeptidase, partial [Lacipirellulaceae bacterium]|nr:M56 family metallopeptidase [Lacipirellulaceae bacterium]
RWFYAVRFVRHVRLGAGPIADETLQATFAVLTRQFMIRRPVHLGESRDLASPAVVGWRPSVILLPADRSGWSAEQLRAALAHELAHVVRDDFGWRLLASFTRAVHCYHPLVHWLVHRLALAQELAADRLAAAKLGGAPMYVKALSELAIRLDDSTRLRAESLVLPSLASDLTRRIAMLRSKDGSVETPRKRLIGVVVAGLITLVGAGTTALRGAAEAVEMMPSDAKEPALFSRAHVDLSILGGPHNGLFIVRVGELMQQPALAAMLESVCGSVRNVWPHLIGAEGPELDLAAIEFFAGTPQLTIQPADVLKESDSPHTGRMIVGFGEAVLRFRRDVAWEAWLERYVPGTMRHVDGELTYYELPEIPAIGAERLLVAAVDDRTLVFGAFGLTRLKALNAGLGDESTAAESSQWAAIEGGLVTFVATDARVDGDMPTPKAPQAEEILKHVERYGFGFDVDRATNQAGLRFDLTCVSAAAAAEVSGALAELLPVMKAELESRINAAGAIPPPSKTEQEYIKLWHSLVDRCTVRVASFSDGAASVQIASTADFPSSLVGMQELAERATVPENQIR